MRCAAAAAAGRCRAAAAVVGIDRRSATERHCCRPTMCQSSLFAVLCVRRGRGCLKIRIADKYRVCAKWRQIYGCLLFKCMCSRHTNTHSRKTHSVLDEFARHRRPGRECARAYFTNNVCEHDTFHKYHTFFGASASGCVRCARKTPSSERART